jgi:hypothetical protein
LEEWGYGHETVCHATGSTPGTTTGTASVRCMSTRSKNSGRSCVPGSALIVGSRRRVCHCTWDSSSSFTTSGLVARGCWAPCSAKRLMRTIEEEEDDSSEYQDFADAYVQLGRFLDDLYNRKRIHSGLGYLIRPSSNSNGSGGRKPGSCSDQGPNQMASRLRSGSDARTASDDAITLPDFPHRRDWRR